MGKCLSSKVLRTSNNNNFQRQSTDFFNDHFCKFQLSLWHNLELPGRESSRGTLSIMLAVFYIIYSRTGITSPCSNSVPNYWKKIFAYVFVWKNRTYLIQSDHYYVIRTKTRGKRRCIYRAFLACKMNAASLVPSLCELFWCPTAWLANASFLTDTSAPWFTGDKSEFLRFLLQRRVCPN